MSRSRAARPPSTVGALLKRSPQLSPSIGGLALETWRQAVGPRLADRTRPVQLVAETLTVEVESSTWAQELSFLSGTILSRLRESGIVLKDIRFRTKRTSHRPRPKLKPAKVAQRAPLPPDLSAKLEKIGDPELRDAIARAASYNLGLHGKKR